VIKIAKNWHQILSEEFSKPYFLSLQQFLEQEYKTKTIYPKPENIFNALNYVPFNQVKVVIFGQDPYHQPNQAHGLCFSVPQGVKLPPSLQNIFKEIESQLGITCQKNGDLSRWARQGVLLLNTVLTVEQGKPASHKGKGWEQLTQKIVQKLSQRQEPIIFVLWGSHAQIFKPLIDQNRHIVLESAHPSPLSAYAGFFGSGHFKTINQKLIQMGHQPIDWQ
jgi:uracil-DNA glycosylase